jgi:hypothetical protein
MKISEQFNMLKMQWIISTFFLILLIFHSFCMKAQNIIIADSTSCEINETVLISISIENSKQFISFQFDMEIPANATLVENSLQLSSRKANHTVTGNILEGNILRILAYSPDNSSFLNNEGEVLSFKLLVQNTTGKFPLSFSNAVIGDNLSTNILTDVQNGLLTIGPLGINENLNDAPIRNFKVFPNPVNENTCIEFLLKNPSSVTILLNDCLGRNLFSDQMGEYSEGLHKIRLPNEIYSTILSGNVYHLGIEVNTREMAHKIVYSKIFK